MMQKIVNAVDIYGVPVGLKYRGETTFKTKFGAVMSLITIILVIAYAGVRSEKMFNRKDSNVQQVSKTLDLFAETDSFNLSGQHLEIVVGLQNTDVGFDYIPIPPEMGGLVFW